jgi:hypothetical protein
VGFLHYFSEKLWKQTGLRKLALLKQVLTETEDYYSDKKTQL